MPYAASGSSLDWAYGEAGIPFTTTMELRDKGDPCDHSPQTPLGGTSSISNDSESLRFFKIMIP